MSFLPRIYADPAFFTPFVAEVIYSMSVPVVHYLGTVLRLQSGSKVVFFNERDGEWLCAIEVIKKGKGSFCIEKQIRTPIIPFGPTLAFALLKRDATDLVIRMGTELGVQCFQPLTTLRTNSHRIKEERLRTIAIEAAEQSNRLTIPEIKPVLSLFHFLEQWPQKKTLLVAIERYKDPKISSKFDIHYQGDEGILIGPEGGFDENEVKALLLFNFVQPLSLGSLILRAETAVTAALARLTAKVRV